MVALSGYAGTVTATLDGSTYTLTNVCDGSFDKNAGTYTGYLWFPAVSKPGYTYNGKWTSGSYEYTIGAGGGQWGPGTVHCTITWVDNGYYSSDFTATFSASPSFTINTYTIQYRSNGGSGSMSNGTKTYGTAYTVASNGFTPPTNYEFNGWNTESDGSGTSYSAGASYTTNAALILYAQWKLIGPSVILDANIYYNEDYLNNDSYTANNYKFPGSGGKASWTKFTSNAKYNTRPTEYRTGKKVYIPNSNSAGFAIRGTPYTHKGQFDVEFCGYYTGSTWANPGIKVYEPNFSWLYENNRNYIVVAIPNTEYFGAAATVSNSDWGDTFYGPASGSEYDSTNSDALEKISDDSLYVPKIDTSVVLNNQNKFDLPPWLKSGSGTYVFYALWSKPNLTFTYNPGSGTAPENNENIQLIGTPGPGPETGTVQSFTIKTFQQTGITPPIGHKFKEWNTASDGTGRAIAVQTIQLGGYLNDVTLYAQYEPYQHTIQFYRQDEDQPLSSATITGGTSWHIENIPTENPNDPHLKFVGIYDINGNIAFDKRGDPVNGIYFTNGLWDYKSDDTNLNLYLRWGLPSNAFIYENNEWKQGVILVNIAESGQEPIWEQIDLADFL